MTQKKISNKQHNRNMITMKTKKKLRRNIMKINTIPDQHNVQKKCERGTQHEDTDTQKKWWTRNKTSHLETIFRCLWLAESLLTDITATTMTPTTTPTMAKTATTSGKSSKRLVLRCVLMVSLDFQDVAMMIIDDDDDGENQNFDFVWGLSVVLLHVHDVAIMITWVTWLAQLIWLTWKAWIYHFFGCFHPIFQT